MESKSFTYTALPPGQFFRLLKIHPGSPSDKLVCELFDSDLGKAPSYVALSYVWGDPAKSAELACSGHACKITQSLSGGLRRIRKPDQVQIAWADAICINQNNQAEKGQQVDLMGVIYDKALEILVWLGLDQIGYSREAFRCLETINEKIYTGTDEEWYVPNREDVPILFPVVLDPETPVGSTAKRSVLPSILGDRGKDCIRELFELPWFSRVWVLQEVGLATTATAFWGDACIEFGEIAAFIYNGYYREDLKHFLGPELSAIIAGSPLYALWNVWATYDKKDSWVYRSPTVRAFAEQLAGHCDIDFTLVLESSCHFKATNKLDHIYAFLGHPMANKPGTNEKWLQADYSLNPKDQHRLLASSLAAVSLNFLVQAQQTEESLEFSDYPSWVPKWDEKNPMHAQAFWEVWDASLRKEQQQSSQTKADGDKLITSGLIIDSVNQFAPTMEEADFEPLDEAGGRLVEKCWEIANQNPRPYPREKEIEAFASTLICHYKARDEASTQYYSPLEGLAGFCINAEVKLFKHLGFWPMDTINKEGPVYGWKFKSYGTNRRFFRTKADGFWGLGPAAMQEGDVCAVLFGADVPFILRPTGIQGEYKIVGECYLYNFMYGEAVLAWQNGSATYAKEEIILV